MNEERKEYKGTMRIAWTNEKRKLSDLIPWPRNPRQVDEAQSQRLADSWDKFGQVETLAIGPDGNLYDGHQRKKVLDALERYGSDFEVDVRVSSRPLTEKEREELTVLLVKAAGDWDWDLLGDWDEGDLIDWGFEEGELEIEKWSEPPSLDELAEEYGEPQERDFWPVVRVTVSPETFDMFNSLMEQTGIEDEALAFERVMGAVDAALFGGGRR